MADQDSSLDPAQVVLDYDDLEPEAEDSGKRKLGLGFWIAIGWLVAISLAAILAPILPIDGANVIAAGKKLESPSIHHWFGTDGSGRDVFARTIWGARVSLSVGFIAIVAGMLIGGPLGILAGYFRGKFDAFISFIFVSLLSFPSLVLALLIVNSLDRSLKVVAMVLGILAIAPIGRLARANTIVFAEREFVQAARVIGAKDMRIMVRELLPNVLIPMGALAMLGMAVAIVAEGGLAFLGLSVKEGASWGKMILEGSGTRTLRKGTHVAMAPIAMMFFTVLALNYAGDRVRAYFDVRETAF